MDTMSVMSDGHYQCGIHPRSDVQNSKKSDIHYKVISQPAHTHMMIP